MDAPMDAVVVHRRASCGEVTQHVAPGIVPVLDEVELGTLEGHAIDAPDPQAVARARRGVVLCQRRADRDELSNVGLLARALPIAWGGRIGTSDAESSGAKHCVPLGS